MPIPPAAFLSYVRLEDQHEEGRITQLKQRLEGEVRVHTGWREFKIFQDRADIRWGQEWQSRLDEAIEAVTFFIPVLTPLDAWNRGDFTTISAAIQSATAKTTWRNSPPYPSQSQK